VAVSYGDLNKRLIKFTAIAFLLLTERSGCTKKSSSLITTEANGPVEDDYETSAPVPEDFSVDAAFVDGSTATILLTKAIWNTLYPGTLPPVHNRTDAAYHSLIRREKDVIFVTYPSEDELEEAKESGVELEVIPVVKDALIFLVNEKNKVESLSSEAIVKIYTGEEKNWQEVGADPGEIIAYQRPSNSVSQTLFLKLAMNGATPTDAPKEMRLV
jgi:phosphate transport system substrate-binding protein